ncbi:MAG: hypothetical protein PHC41_07395 [Lachnospiraceae bacterium]|nr:hypothetical protein [Lachnospiraceae bacterium]MDD3616037.1 hypothetical protein [Lachnospiraceae bacterium]
MRLLKLELHKTLTNKKNLIVLAILLVVYIVMGFSTTYYSYGGTENYNTYTSMVEEHTGTLDEAQGVVSTDAYTEAKNKYGSGEAIDHYKMADPVLKFNADYADFNTAVNDYYEGKEAGKQDIDNLIGIAPLQDKLTELQASGQENSYEYARYEKQLETEKELGAPTFENVSFWDSLFSNWSGMNVLLLLLFPIAYFIAPIFTQEVRTGMDNIVLCSKKGRKEIVTSKIITGVITAVVMSILFVAGTFIGTFAATGNMAGAGFSMRCLASFRTAQYAFTIGQFALVSVLWIVFIAIVFSMVALLISALMSNQAGAFGVSFIVLLVGMATEIFGSGLKKLLWPIVDFSFNSLGKLSSIFGGTTTYNLFGQPISYAMLGVAVATVMLSAFIIFVYAAQKKRIVR